MFTPVSGGGFRLRWASVTTLLPLLGPLGVVLLGGCASVQTKPTTTANLAEYRRVYIQAGDETTDPRKVMPRVADRLRQCGFDVRVVGKGDPIVSQGSGFLVDAQGHLLTCAHVLGQKTTNATVWISGQRFNADVILSDTNKDMALLKVRAATNTFAPLPFAASTNLSMGQDVFTMGFPLSELLGSSPRLTKGLLSATVGFEDNPEQVQVSAEVQSGNSGGPLLNDRAEVIGLVTATLNPMNVLARTGDTLPQNVNFAAKGAQVRGFLAQTGVEPRVSAADAKPLTFDQVKDSIVLVRAGVVPEDATLTKEMLCVVKYVYHWDMWWRFRVFHVEFRDLKKGELLLRTGQYNDTVFTSEDKVIDRVFEEIRANFFPGQAKPAAKKPAAAASPKGTH
jgi:S1-C subfamily serine protease